MRDANLEARVMIRLVLVVFCVGAMVGVSAGDVEPGGAFHPGVGNQGDTRTDADQAYGPLPEPDDERTEWPYFVDAASVFRVIDDYQNPPWAGGDDPDDPNYCNLTVKKTSRDSRSIIEYDLSMVPDEFDRITFETNIRNNDVGDPIETVEFYHFVGNGQMDDEDGVAGEYFWTLVDAFPDVGLHLRLDVTDLVRQYKQQGNQYLGLRLSSPDDFARFALGKSLGSTAPCPYLRVLSPFSPVSADDYAYFEWCMWGPDFVYAQSCLLVWDFDYDEDVDLADFAVFQTLK